MTTKYYRVPGHDGTPPIKPGDRTMKSMLKPTPTDRAAVQAEARAGILAEKTAAAAQSAELTLSAVRQAHEASCGDHMDALEILLIDAIEDAAKLHRRLQMIAGCASSPLYLGAKP